MSKHPGSLKDGCGMLYYQWFLGDLGSEANMVAVTNGVCLGCGQQDFKDQYHDLASL